MQRTLVLVALCFAAVLGAAALWASRELGAIERAQAGDVVRLEAERARVAQLEEQDADLHERIAEAPSAIADTLSGAAARASDVLLVRVVDGASRPVAGVPVGVCTHAGGTNRIDRLRALSGADGVARFDRFRAELGELASRVELGAELAIVAREKPFAPIERTTAELTLVLPACGCLRVRTLDSQGRPLAASSVRARAAVTGEPVFPGSFEHSSEPAPELAEDHARFPFVELGLVVQVRGEHALHDPQRAEGPGPRFAGEEAGLDLVFATPSLLLTGRCVTEEGAPVADARLRVEGSWRPDVGAAFTLTTDSDGRFRHALVGEAPSKGTVRFALHVFDTPAHRDREGRVERALELARGANDLGEIVLALPPLLVSGRVRDEDGAAVAGARVWAAWIDRPRERTVANPLRMRDTDAEGRFELNAACDEPDFELHAAKEGHTAVQALRVAVGTRGLDVVLRRRTETPDAKPVPR